MGNESELLLIINPNSGTPIYRQVRDQVTRMVASGQLKAGEALPSVRQVAIQFEVNPMTISKAYGMLEADGVLERIRGVGMKVAHRKDLEQSLAERLRLLAPTLEALATQIAQLQIPKSDALKAIRSLLEKES